MSSNKLMIVLGIRPDVIRAAIILKELKKRLKDDFVFVWSGQHYSDNMKDVFFRQLDVPAPDITLDLDKSSDTSLIGSLISKLGAVVSELKPRAVVFLGDTNTVVASLAVASLDIPIVHIEGCMRSYDWRMPEEKFRTTIDHLADVIYSYLPEYKSQGVLEGIDPDQILVTGNPIVDILETYFLSGEVRLKQDQLERLLESVGNPGPEMWVMTCHRRENVDSKQALSNILKLASTTKSPVVFPAGYRTQRKIQDFRLEIPKNVTMVDPMGYAELMELIYRSVGVMTDSGTIVEEASVIGIPSVQMRTATERPQVYDAGGSVKFDPHSSWSDKEFSSIITSAKLRRNKTWEHGLGDGRASQRIVDDLIERLNADNWNGHVPNAKLRPIERNFGFGHNENGRANDVV